MTYVLAKTISGSTLTFNTKAQTGRNSEVFCELVRVQQPHVSLQDIPQLPEAQVILYLHIYSFIVIIFLYLVTWNINFIAWICN